MNGKMWEHSATKENVATFKRRAELNSSGPEGRPALPAVMKASVVVVEKWMRLLFFAAPRFLLRPSG